MVVCTDPLTIEQLIEYLNRTANSLRQISKYGMSSLELENTLATEGVGLLTSEIIKKIESNLQNDNEEHKAEKAKTKRMKIMEKVDRNVDMGDLADWYDKLVVADFFKRIKNRLETMYLGKLTYDRVSFANARVISVASFSGIGGFRLKCLMSISKGIIDFKDKKKDVSGIYLLTLTSEWKLHLRKLPCKEEVMRSFSYDDMYEWLGEMNKHVTDNVPKAFKDYVTDTCLQAEFWLLDLICLEGGYYRYEILMRQCDSAGNNDNSAVSDSIIFIG